jgi:hypothetical protein
MAEPLSLGHSPPPQEPATSVEPRRSGRSVSQPTPTGPLQSSHTSQGNHSPPAATSRATSPPPTSVELPWRSRPRHQLRVNPTPAEPLNPGAAKPAAFSDQRPTHPHTSHPKPTQASIAQTQAVGVISAMQSSALHSVYNASLLIDEPPQFGFTAPFPTVVFVTVFGLSRSGRVGSQWGVRSPGDLAATYCFAAVGRAQGHLRGRPPTGAFPPCGTSPLATDGTVGGPAPPLVGSIGAGGEQTVGSCGVMSTHGSHCRGTPTGCDTRNAAVDADHR